VRSRFAENVDRLAADLAAMCTGVESMMGDASRALMSADLDLAEQVIATQEECDSAARQWEQTAFALLALQAPVASDLRLMIGGMHIAADLERMGALTTHIAEAVLRRHPAHVVPTEAHDILADMGRVAVAVAGETHRVLAQRDPVRAAALERADSEMDALHRALFERITSDRWEHGVMGAVDVTLLGRFYERFCDHAVAIGHRVIFLETGLAGDAEEGEILSHEAKSPGTDQVHSTASGYVTGIGPIERRGPT
jgi:phosphate transport system protein